MSGLPYVPALDGVRALAVAAVVLYHGQVGWLPAGFLGVDIFFVLSGYLITSLLLNEYRRIGSIALGSFWMGRARRLLPAALLVIVVCLIVVRIFYAGDMAKLLPDALWSVLYANNWHQIVVGHSYFAHFGRPSLLQHYWSLAVEEQFYLVWPIVLGLGLTFAKRRGIVLTIVGAAIASAVLMGVLFHPGLDPSRVYYGTDTRAMPLMIGAILAFAWPLGRMSGRAARGALLILDLLAAAAIGGLILAMHAWHDYDTFLYRGGFAVTAILAAVLIATAAKQGTVVGRVLGTRPLRWIGQRSYGIYLWHWPVMALTRPGIDVRWSSTLLLGAQAALTVLLAALSYKFVEMPIRRRQAWPAIKRRLDGLQPSHRTAVIVGAPAAACVILALVVLLPVRSARTPLRALSSSAAASPVKRAVTPHRQRVPAATSSSPKSRGSFVASRALTGGVLAVGASVMLAAQSDLQRHFGARVDAAVGRQPGAIIDRLETYRQAGALPPNVIVQIGDNGPVWSGDMRRLKSVLQGVPHVVLVNVREPDGSWQGEVNGILSQYVQHWPQASIADWLSSSSDPNLTYDGAHPNPAGGTVYARVISQAFGKLLVGSDPPAPGTASSSDPSAGSPSSSSGAPTSQTASSASSIRATMVGDSVSAGIDEAPAALHKLTRGLHIRLDLRVCRRLIAPSCPYQGSTPPTALQTVESLGNSLGSVLVIDVGYNDDAAGFSPGINRVMRYALAHHVHSVIWVNLRVTGGYASEYRAINANLAQAARRWPQLHVADWNRYSAGKPWFAGDGLHLSSVGAVGLATFLRPYILAQRP
ncbi:MAG: acyltransferase family protein [Solirubrobacteraceae bacterium]